MIFPDNILKRQHYLHRIEAFIGKQIIKVFTGQRRVGKSYLLFQIIAFLKESNPETSIIYINKEDLSFSFIKNAEDLQQYILEHKSKTQITYVFIDEIQDIENFEAALRSLHLLDDLDLYCTGSNANLLSGDIAGHLSGRYIEIEVYSLSYIEFLQFHNLQDSYETLEKFMKYGGLPYLKHLTLQDEVVFEYLKNIYSTIVYKDIINRYAVRNVRFLEQLVLFVAAHIGSIFSSKKISDFLKSQQINIAPNQVQTYIKHLENAFLIHAVQRYDMIGKRIFEVGQKYYFENLGIRNSIWGYRLEDRGKIMENIVYNHLVYKGYKVQIGNMAAEEIDFICEKNGEIAYYQVALSINEEKTMLREFGNLNKIKDHYPKTVVTMEGFTGNTFQGIQSINLRSFLLN